MRYNSICDKLFYNDNKYIDKIVTLIVSILFILVIFFVGSIVSRYIKNISFISYSFNIIIQAVIFLIIFFIISNIVPYLKMKEILTNSVINRKSLINGFNYGFISIIFSLVILVIINITLSFSAISNSISNSFLLLNILNLIVISIYEELIFRAGAYNILRKSYGKYYSMIIITIVFGLLHYNSTLSKIITPTTSGLIFTYSYEKTDNIIVPILAHSIFNIFILLIKTSIL